MNNSLSVPIKLPCGVSLPNRLAKAAMSEGLSDLRNHSTPQLDTLYRTWSASGAGMLLSGNIQVDRWHLERPRNVVIDDESGFDALKRLAKAGTGNGNHFWAQLSHTGRQVHSALNWAPKAPSAVEVDVMRGSRPDFCQTVSDERGRHTSCNPSIHVCGRPGSKGGVYRDPTPRRPRVSNITIFEPAN